MPRAPVTALYQAHALGLEDAHQPAEISAEAAGLTSEERREVMRALRRLPSRQREALVLRFYLDEPEAEIARVMGTGPADPAPASKPPAPRPGGAAACQTQLWICRARP